MEPSSCSHFVDMLLDMFSLIRVEIIDVAWKKIVVDIYFFGMGQRLLKLKHVSSSQLGSCKVENKSFFL